MAIRPKGVPSPRKRPAPPAPPVPPSPPRLERGGPRRQRLAPSKRVLTPSSGTVTLEEVLVGFQRSLARATRSSLETARADSQVGLGQRSLYVVDSIGVTLQAGLIAAVDADGQVQSLSLDLGQTAGNGSSTLEFRVQARPIEAIASEQLTLADTDPLGHARPRHRMRFTLIGRHDGSQSVVRPVRGGPPPAGARSGPGPSAAVEATPAPAPTWVPLPDCDLTVRIVGGDTGKSESFVVRTNKAGQVDLEIDAPGNRVLLAGNARPFETLDLNSRDDDFFVYASCAPQRVEGGEVTGHLSSNVVQFWVTREAPADKGKPR